MRSGDNLPPGVMPHMIPGNRPEDMEEEAFWEELGKKLDAEGITQFANCVAVETVWDDVNFMKMIILVRDAAYSRGYSDGSDDAMTHVAGEAQMAEDNYRARFRAEQRQMSEAHAEGLHADAPREFCPECEASGR